MEHEIRYLLDRGEAGDDEEAMRLCDEALEAAPHTAEVLILRSEALRNLDLYEEAVEAARFAVACRNGAASVHLALGEALLDLADESGDPSHVDEAVKALRAAVDREPDLERGWYWLAEALARRGDGPRALEIVAWLAVRSRWAELYVSRAVRLVEDGASPPPLDERTGDGRHPDAYRLYGMMLRATGDTEGARREFLAARETDPLSPELDYQIALTSLIAARPEDAIAELAYVRQFRVFSVAAELESAACIDLGRSREARTCLEDALHRARSFGADDAYLARLEEALLAMAAPGDAGLAQARTLLTPPLDPKTQAWGAAAREAAIGSSSGSAEEHCDLMGSAACARFGEAGRATATAGFIASTAAVYAHPSLNEQAWEAAETQFSEMWEDTDAATRRAIAGVLVLGAWLNTSEISPAVDQHVLAAASAAVTAQAAAAVPEGDAVRAEVEELLEAVKELQPPVAPQAAWNVVSRAFGAERAPSGIMHRVLKARAVQRSDEGVMGR